jgi:hypothetical protein
LIDCSLTFVSSDNVVAVSLSAFTSGLLSVDEELLLLFMLTSTTTPFDCGASGGVVVVVMAVFCRKKKIVDGFLRKLKINENHVKFCTSFYHPHATYRVM